MNSLIKRFQEQTQTWDVSRIAQLMMHIVVLAVLSLGGLLRFYNLGYRAFWSDEAVPVYYWQGSISEVLTKVVKDLHPPLWFIVTNLVSRFGNTDFIIRIPSAVAGILSLLLIYWIGKSLFSWKVGLVTALILGLNTLHIYHSQEARLYSLFGFFAITTTWLLWNAVEKKRLAWWAAYGVFTALEIYTHYNSLFVISTQGFYITILFIYKAIKQRSLVKDGLKEQILSYIGSLLLAAILFSPWAVNLVNDIPRLLSGEGVSWGELPRNWTSIRDYFEYLLLFLFSGYDQGMVIPYLALFFIGLTGALLKKQFKQVLFAGSLLLIPIFIVTIVLMKAAHPRYFFYGLPMYVLFAARGLETIFDLCSWLIARITKFIDRVIKQPVLPPISPQLQVLVPALAFIIVLGWFLNLNFAQLHRYYESDSIGSWREIADFMMKNSQSGDLVLSERSVPLSRYLTIWANGTVLAGDFGNYSLEQAQEAYHSGKNVWVIMPMNYWNITPETRQKTIQWSTDVPHVEINFGGWAFPGAIVYYLSPGKTQEQLYQWFSQNAHIPDQPNINLSLAQDYRSAHMVDEAVAQYKQAMRAGSVGPFVPGHLNEKAIRYIHLRMGHLYYENNLNKNAISEYLQYLPGDEKNIALLVRISSLYQKIGDQAAANHYRQLADAAAAEQGLGIYQDLNPLAAAYHNGSELNNQGELAMYFTNEKTSSIYNIEPGKYTIQVYARGDQGCNLWPILNVYTDNKLVGSTQVTSADIQLYEFPNIKLKQNQVSIGLQFTQPADCSEAYQDVNLYVRGLYTKKTGNVVIKPAVNEDINMQTLANSYHNGSSYQEGMLTMYWVGLASAPLPVGPGTYTVSITAWGQQGCGIWPEMKLWVDGTDMGVQTVDSSEPYEYLFKQIKVKGKQEHLIGIEFIQPGTCEQSGQHVYLFIGQVNFKK